MRVLFWGTPEFGLPSLDALRVAGHEVVGVVTNPDRPSGRGRKVVPSPVKRWALDAGVPVLQPERPRGDVFLAEVRALAPDLSVVAAYGQILREDVLSLPPHGSLNVHASLLPALRGAAPVNWAIILGHEESGVSIMRMVLALDAGPVFRRVRCAIGPDTTAGELYETLARLGGPALVETLDELDRGVAMETPQDDADATYAPKLDREMARVDWSRPAVEVGRWMRGCDPWPGAWTTLDGERLGCFAPRLAARSIASSVAPGTVLAADPAAGLLIATGAGVIGVGEVLPAGRRRMPAADWLRGREGVEGARLV